MAFFHHIKAVSANSRAPFLPTWSLSARFRHLSTGANLRENLTHPLAHSAWCHFSMRFLPGQGLIQTNWTSQPKLPGDQWHQIAPALALFWCTEHWQSPIVALLGKAI